MAVYKVIQDIEAEDKLFGPLTLKGFIYVAVAGVLIFIDVRLLISGFPGWLKLLLTLLFLPPTLLFGTLASPLGHEQPTEVWLLSHIRFLLKTRQRNWDQSGIKQLVTITAPKKLSRTFSKNFSQEDVSSRLQALANTLDSRGWTIKNVSLSAAPALFANVEENDDRLATASALAVPEPVLDIRPDDDILDEQNNRTAQNVQNLIKKQDDTRKALLSYGTSRGKAPHTTNPTNAEQAFLAQLHTREAELHKAGIEFGAPQQPNPQVFKQELANAGNELSVAAVASLAKRNAQAGGAALS